jgi:hypothetical protein
VLAVTGGRATSVGTVKFAGELVGFETDTQGGTFCPDGADVYLTVVDLADGSTRIQDHAANLACYTEFDGLDQWLMSANGAIVYLTHSGTRQPFQERWTLTAHDRAGVRVLDSVTTSSSESPITDVRLAGNAVLWSNAGAPRSAALN